MKRALHILTRENDALASEVISRQREQPGVKVEVIDLTHVDPDYAALLELVFTADSVAVW